MKRRSQRPQHHLDAGLGPPHRRREHFCSEAIYARPLEGQAFFFGTRCKLKRPGLAIDSDSIEYRWQDKIGVFDGHVLYIDSDGEKAFVHVEYDFNKNKIA